MVFIILLGGEKYLLLLHRKRKLRVLL